MENKITTNGEIIELENVAIYKFKDIYDYRENLDKEPSESMILKRDLGAGKSAEYVPIHVQEALADVFFREWNVISEDFKIVQNEICYTVKIEYLPDYPGADFKFCTGSGAKPIQTKSGSKVEDFPIGKITNSLEYCLPASRSNAKSNAFNDIGNIFGRNVARKCSNNFSIKSK